MVIIFPNIHVHNCLIIIILYLCWLGVEVNIPIQDKRYDHLQSKKKGRERIMVPINKNSRRNPKIPSIHLDNVPI